MVNICVLLQGSSGELAALYALVAAYEELWHVRPRPRVETADFDTPCVRVVFTSFDVWPGAGLLRRAFEIADRNAMNPDWSAVYVEDAEPEEAEALGWAVERGVTVYVNGGDV